MTPVGPRLIAGLGNPGAQYAETRHNLGFMVAEALAVHFGIHMDRYGFGTLHGFGRIADCAVVLVKPLSFMNRSGEPLKRLADHLRISGEEMIVIHDDIDLPFESLKIKKKGGDGGHKGIRSIIDAFGDDAFVRIRIGVGRPEIGSNVVQYVLEPFMPEEAAPLEEVVGRARDAVVAVLGEGAQAAMNLFNRKRT